jgi:hypothetical protein
VKCPQHACLVCDGKASNRGGLLFRCTDCPSTVCESCLPESFEAVDRNEVVAVLGFLSGSIEYIRCSACLTKPPNALYHLLHDGGLSSEGGKSGGPTSSSERDEDGSGSKLPSSSYSESKKSAMASVRGVPSSVTVSSDDELDTPLVLLKSVAQSGSDQPSPLQDIEREGASGSAEVRKRRLEIESSPDKGRPTRHCATVGADARFARQLQDSRMLGESAGTGVQARSPKHSRTPKDSAAGQGLPSRRLPGMDDIETQELAWSSAQTPTTQKPPNKSGQADEFYVKSTSLHFPSILPENGTVDESIEISSD